MSDVRLSAAVMAHPQRAGTARSLADRLPEFGAEVVWDPDPDGPPSALRSARAAWAAAPPEATHHLVLQDDALPVDGFGDRLTALLRARPEAAFSLFTEWGSRTSHAVRIAAMRGFTLAPVVDDYVPCVGLVLPTATARAFAEYAATRQGSGEPDDVALLRFLADHGTEVLIPVANLLGHDDRDSIVGNGVMGRRWSVCLPPAPVSDAPYSELTGLTGIPYYDFWGQYSDACLPDASTVDGWIRTSARRALLARGIDHARLMAGLESSLARRPESALLEDRLGEIPLAEVWIVAFLLGVIAAEHEGKDGASLDLTGPTARTALSTLGPGAVRRVVPARWLPAVGALLEPVVLDAVRAGIESAAVGGS
ncbi:hypothetical protein [Nocardiopsis baichengensis]|uniref:hypothetical protein n=1 Tax=Nocardiopsis baichengensis TaxID=280240 RepID=UPI0003484651|nr:hypothetical protein [Nocardiopsis baichengensis]